MTLPDFLIVGVQKGGTTALSTFLQGHPQLEMSSPKEVHFFDRQSVTKQSPEEIRHSALQAYEGVFSKDSAKLRGEATPIYCYFPESLRAIEQYRPDIKLIILLRDPVERAYSHYQMEHGRGNEKLPFWLALLLESKRLRGDREKFSEESSHRRHSYRDRGYYARQLEYLFTLFAKDQVLILDNSDLRVKHKVTLSRVFSFLGVENVDIEPREVFASGGAIREVPVSSFFLRLMYRKEMRRLQGLVDIDVTSW